MSTTEQAASAVSARPTAPKDIVNRLRRAQGQLTAVISAVESGGDCREVVTQLSAVSSAIDRAGFLIISRAMRECLEDPEAENTPSVEELEKLFLSFA